MAKKQDVKIDDLVTIKPITESQEVAFEAFKKDNKELFLHGAAGTGKTFISLYLALEKVLDPSTPYPCVYLIRSAVPTREIGFLPGDEEDKTALYQIPYQNMVQFMFEQPSDQAFTMLYDRLKAQGSIMFLTTSYLRGITLDNAIIIVDECQNLNFHELDSIITRIGENSLIIFCGDASQSDLVKTNDRNGIHDFLNILRKMPSFDIIEYGIDDIVRSGLVKEYIIAKLEIGL